MNIEKQYDLFAKEYISTQKKFFNKNSDEAMSSIKNFLPKLSKKKVLDIGCGAGKQIKIYEQLGAKEVWGIDSSKEMIIHAKNNATHSKRIFVASIEKTPFKNNMFDVIVGRYSFHYLNNFDKAYIEMSRLLKKGGCLIIVVDHPIKRIIRQKTKKYDVQEIITLKVYDQKVIIQFPSHNFSEYFSKEFFKHFYIDGYFESRANDVKPDKYNSPDFMTIKAVKK